MGESSNLPTVREIPFAEMHLWDSFAEQVVGASLYHRSAWRAVVDEVFGHKTIYLTATDDSENCVGMLPLVQMNSSLFGNFMVSLPFLNGGGVISNDSESRQALVQRAVTTAQQAGCTHVELRQLEDLDLAWSVRTDKIKMILELPDTVDEYSQFIGSKRRSQINRARREKPEVLHGGEELLRDFYDVFAHVMRDLGTPVYSSQLFSSVCKHLDSSAHIIVIRLDGQAVAGALLVSHQDTIEIPWAATLWSVNSLSVNMLLYWEAVSYAIEKGFRYFDFGRCSKDSGSHKFKKQWGAQSQQLYWNYWLSEGQKLPEFSANNAKYSALSRMWQKLPISISRLVGPHIVRNIP